MNLPQVGDVLEGTVVRVYPRYAILLFEEGYTGLLHISELSNKFIWNFSSLVSVGNIYNVKVVSVEEGNIKVSLKRMTQQDKLKAYAKKKIEDDQIDFTALKDNLPEWIENEERKDEYHDQN